MEIPTKRNDKPFMSQLQNRSEFEQAFKIQKFIAKCPSYIFYLSNKQQTSNNFSCFKSLK